MLIRSNLSGKWPNRSIKKKRMLRIDPQTVIALSHSFGLQKLIFMLL